ncbi:hypothetical protein [Cryobacterium sp. SO1]|uniref:hypothetical protein n=1 Tax=Cryobacterium sp. SO1 TaxID=1897061 RepID=UPI0013EE6567|nr:hypothetical protein [Cryobacterium sp. SO1]
MGGSVLMAAAMADLALGLLGLAPLAWTVILLGSRRWSPPVPPDGGTAGRRWATPCPGTGLLRPPR